jgi:flagellar biosynthesis component FlhA
MHDFLIQIGDLLPVGKRNVALVVRNPDLRPFVRRLVAYTFPYLMVLSVEELVADNSVPSSAFSS